MKEYVLKNPILPTFKAIQVGLTNGDEIRKFVGFNNIETVSTGYGYLRAVRVYAQLPGYMNWVHVAKGYWVVKEPNGDIKVLTNSQFDKEYKPAVPATVTFQFYKEPAASPEPLKKKPSKTLASVRILQSDLRSLRRLLQYFADEKEGDLDTLKDRATREAEEAGKAASYTTTAVSQVAADVTTIRELISAFGRISERASDLVPALQD